MGKFLTQKDWRFELVINNVSFGLWNSDDLTLGSESQSGIDPEDGAFIAGGAKTAEDVTIDRYWKLSRESVKYQQLCNYRGTPADAKLIEHERDPDTGQPTSATPLAVRQVGVKEVVRPGGDAEGSDKVKIQVTLTVKP